MRYIVWKNESYYNTPPMLFIAREDYADFHFREKYTVRIDSVPFFVEITLKVSTDWFGYCDGEVSNAYAGTNGNGAVYNKATEEENNYFKSLILLLPTGPTDL